MNKSKLLLIGKGGKKEGMGHLVRISVMVDALILDYDVSVLVKQDRFGDYFFKQKSIKYFTYHDNRGLLRFLEKTGKYEIIVIDIYRISIGVIEKIGNYCNFLVNFDDMQRRIREQINGVFLCPQEPFKSKIDSRRTVTVIMGSDYFPLRKVFKDYRKQKRFRGDVKDVGLILGGVPSKSRLLELTKLLDNFLDKKIKLHIVMGFEPGEIRTTQFSSRVDFLKNVNNMASLITKLDVGVIAGGFLKFEFMCIGTPFVLISLCAHQEKLAGKFSSRGYGVYLGKFGNLLLNPGKFKNKMESFLSNEPLRRDMFIKSRQLVDGDGGSRILKIVNEFNERRKLWGN